MLNYTQSGNVAPYVGAWIETAQTFAAIEAGKSHPTWVRGLKLQFVCDDDVSLGRTLRGCVD